MNTTLVQEEDHFPLDTYYTLWYHGITEKKWDKDSYIKIGIIHSIKDFWTYYNNINTFLKGIFFLMKEDILPIWEVPDNINGGYWSFRVDRDKVDDIWTKLSIQLITENICNSSRIESDELEDSEESEENESEHDINILKHDINGISISPKAVNAVIKIWNNDSSYCNLDDINTITDIDLESSYTFYRPHKKHKDILKLNK